MPERKLQKLTSKEMGKLLNKQTVVILSAVDKKVTGLEKKLEKVELSINQKIDKLVTTLDRFLKRLTDIEDEFEMMKADINRVKKIIKVKLGVDLF